jgi:hypothetical protein
MPKLTNVQERIHRAYELTTPDDLVSCSEKSMLILQVAVPPDQEVARSDVLYITVDGSVKFEHPLRPLMDMYRSELREAAEVYLKIEKLFVALTRKLVDGTVKVDAETLRELQRLHFDLRFGASAGDGTNGKRYTHLVPQAHAAVGVLVARAILVPPRCTLRVFCDRGSKVTVYLGGLEARTVS